MQVDEHLLISGSSPREIKTMEGFIEMKAHTFDWWIPIKPPFSLTVDPEKTFAKLRSKGWTGPLKTTVTLDGSIKKVPMAYNMELNSDTIQDNIFLPVFNGEQNWEGEHRDVSEATVKIEYKFEWNSDQLNISLTNRSTDRNYIVYIVLEEKMIYSGQILHSAFPVAVNGQLTYVPQKFFDDERKAWEKLAKAINDFNDHYSKSATVGPQDPVIGWARPNDLYTTEGLEQIASLAEQHQPELFHQIMEAHGFKMKLDKIEMD